MIEENEETQQPDETPAQDESAVESPQSAQTEPEAEPPAEDAPAGDAPVEDAPAAEAPAADEAPAAAAEPEEVVHPKERRRRARSEHRGEARPQRGAEERSSERAAKRSRLSASRRAYRQKQRSTRADRPRPEVPQQEGKEHGPGAPRVRQGIVVSAKPDKTITVRIDIARRHRTYKKIVRSSSTLHAHDERNEANEGDTVRVVETRPLSRTKRWRLVEILERAR